MREAIAMIWLALKAIASTIYHTAAAADEVAQVAKEAAENLRKEEGLKQAQKMRELEQQFAAINEQSNTDT